MQSSLLAVPFSASSSIIREILYLLFLEFECRATSGISEMPRKSLQFWLFF